MYEESTAGLLRVICDVKLQQQVKQNERYNQLANYKQHHAG